jgi:hypothetical protein
MIARLCPSRPVRPRRPALLRIRQNDRRSAALILSCSDGSDGKLDSRLACAYARAGTASAMCGQICRCGRVLRPRVRRVLSPLGGTRLFRGFIVAKWNRFGIIRNQIFFDVPRTQIPNLEGEKSRRHVWRQGRCRKCIGAEPTAGTDQRMPKQSRTKRKGKRRWRESRSSHPWCRGRMDGQSASSPSGLIPFTIPKSISDGVSKCSLTPASDASGSRPGTAASRPRRSIGYSLIISKSFATAAHPSTQPNGQCLCGAHHTRKTVQARANRSGIGRRG